jgi:hypothetical protein
VPVARAGHKGAQSQSPPRAGSPPRAPSRTLAQKPAHAAPFRPSRDGRGRQAPAACQELWWQSFSMRTLASVRPEPALVNLICFWPEAAVTGPGRWSANYGGDGRHAPAVLTRHHPPIPPSAAVLPLEVAHRMERGRPRSPGVRFMRGSRAARSAHSHVRKFHHSRKD